MIKKIKRVEHFGGIGRILNNPKELASYLVHEFCLLDTKFVKVEELSNAIENVINSTVINYGYIAGRYICEYYRCEMIERNIFKIMRFLGSQTGKLDDSFNFMDFVTNRNIHLFIIMFDLKTVSQELNKIFVPDIVPIIVDYIY